MNLHKLRKQGFERNTALTDLDWMERGYVLIVDAAFNCLEVAEARTARYCFAPNGPRGHGQPCLERADGTSENTNGHQRGADTLYMCECRCHTEDNIGIYGTFAERARGTENGMYGRPDDEEDPYVDEVERGLNVYWCTPCRRTEHHWTE
jgi:hypothetical protein